MMLNFGNTLIILAIVFDTLNYSMCIVHLIKEIYLSFREIFNDNLVHSFMLLGMYTL